MEKPSRKFNFATQFNLYYQSFKSCLIKAKEC